MRTPTPTMPMPPPLARSYCVVGFFICFSFCVSSPARRQAPIQKEEERERVCVLREDCGDKISSSSLAKFALCLQIILDFMISFSPCRSLFLSLSLYVYLLLFLWLFCFFINSNPLAKTITRYKVNNNNNTSYNINNNNTNNVRARSCSSCNAQWGKCRK